MADAMESDCIIVAVAHDAFEKIGLNGILKLYSYNRRTEGVLIDVKGIYSKTEAEAKGLRYWRL